MFGEQLDVDGSHAFGYTRWCLRSLSIADAEYAALSVQVTITCVAMYASNGYCAVLQVGLWL